MSTSEDVGLVILRRVFDRMRVDSEWSLWEARSFAWWAHGLRQRIWVTEGFESNGMSVYRIVATSDMLRTTAVPAGDLAVMLAAPLPHLSGSMIRDPETGAVRLWMSMIVHEEAADWQVRVFAFYAVLQMIEAGRLASAAAEQLRGTVDWSGHPLSGSRAAPDELVEFVDLVVRPDGRELPPGISEHIQAIGPYIRGMGLDAESDERLVSVVVPYLGDTAVIEIGSTQPHAWLGSGVTARLILPYRGSSREAAALVDILSIAEATDAPAQHFIGRWCCLARSEVDWEPGFVFFVPTHIYRFGFLDQFIFPTMFSRIAWALDLLHPSHAA